MKKQLERVHDEIDGMLLSAKSLQGWEEQLDAMIRDSQRFGCTPTEIGRMTADIKTCMRDVLAEYNAHKENADRLMRQYLSLRILDAPRKPLSNYGHLNDIDTSSVYTQPAA